MSVWDEDVVVVPPLLGRVISHGRVMHVFDGAETVAWVGLDPWLTRQVGVVIWGANRSPCLTVDEAVVEWMVPGSRHADNLVAAVMHVVRTVRGLPDDPDDLIPAPHGDRVGGLPMVDFDFPHLATRMMPAIGQAAVPIPEAATSRFRGVWS